MAVTVIQSPTTPNVTGTNLVYTLSSSLAVVPQYRFVTDIYESGSNNFITRIKTYPNLHGSGVVDVARELDDQLGFDNNWKTAFYPSYPTSSVNTFNLKFGEEYGTSISSSRTIYTGSSDNYLQVFPGNVYKSEESFNFNTSSILDNSILSNAPEATQVTPSVEDYLWVGNTDYHTITLLKEDSFIAANVYDENGSYLGGHSWSNTIPFTTVGIGPQNLIDAGVFPSVIQNAARIEVVFQSSPQYTLTLSNDPSYPCNREYTRFAFVNNYGFWDYYNVYNPLRKQTQVDRSLYERTFVRYEESVAYYNISDRGNTQYKTDYTDSYIITTDYITKETSQWLTELFNSPEVYVQEGSNFIPINILNNNVRWNMNSARQKLFQYDIEFKYANKRQSR